jgi:hypothetical protein
MRLRNKYSIRDASQGVNIRSIDIGTHEKNGYWWVDITYEGKRVRKSTRTKVRQEAQRIHDQTSKELWKNQHVITAPKKFWMDAVVRWLSESAHKRSLVTDKYHLTWLDPYLRDLELNLISSELIEYIALEQEKTLVSLTTVNRVLELVRAILNKAHKEWKWVDTIPLIRMRKIENKRKWNFITGVTATRWMVRI